MEKKQISINVNGEIRQVIVEASDILLDVLRNKLGIKSPKNGCGRGDCGACTVLLDGKSVRSCLILAAEVDGCHVVTVEGLGGDRLSELQRSFHDHNSFQCGFCAPGMILTAEELLAENPEPSKDEIKEAIAGNLCRCTGYERIIEAIQDVSTKHGNQE